MVVPAVEEEGRVARVVEHGWWKVQQQDKQLLQERLTKDKIGCVERLKEVKEQHQSTISRFHIAQPLKTPNSHLSYNYTVSANYNTGYS